MNDPETGELSNIKKPLRVRITLAYAEWYLNYEYEYNKNGELKKVTVEGVDNKTDKKKLEVRLIY